MPATPTATPQSRSANGQPQPSSNGWEHAQASIGTILAPLVAHAFRVIDLDDLGPSLHRFNMLIAGIVHEYGRVAAMFASQWFQEVRNDAGVPGVVRVPLADAVSEKALAAELDVSQILTAPAITPKVEAAAAQDVTAQVEKIVLERGDQTILQAVEHDRQATGWARGLEPGFCAFCGMLASRGDVYHTEETASVKVHLHCRCYPIPVYGTYTPGHREQRAIDLWNESTRPWMSPNEKLNAFRDRLEGRQPSPERREQAARVKHERESQSQLDRDVALGPQRRAELIARLRNAEAACKKTGLVKTLKAVRERIAQLEQANIEQARRAA